MTATVSHTDQPVGEDLPGIYVNGVGVTINELVRVVFVEAVQNRAIPRVVLIMTFETARNIATFIQAMEEKHQDTLRTNAVAAAKAAGENKPPC